MTREELIVHEVTADQGTQAVARWAEIMTSARWAGEGTPSRTRYEHAVAVADEWATSVAADPAEFMRLTGSGYWHVLAVRAYDDLPPTDAAPRLARLDVAHSSLGLAVDALRDYRLGPAYPGVSNYVARGYDCLRLVQRAVDTLSTEAGYLAGELASTRLVDEQDGRAHLRLVRTDEGVQA